jgi:hypothetical protein
MKVAESTKLSDAIAADEADLPAVPGLSCPRIAGFTLAMSCSGRLADSARLDRDHSVLVRWRTGFPYIRSISRILLTKFFVSRSMGKYAVRLACSIDTDLHAER